MYSNWAEGEPSSRYEQCLMVDTQTGKWKDQNCHEQLNVICEKTAAQLEDALFHVPTMTVEHNGTTTTEPVTVAVSGGPVVTRGVIIALSIGGAFLFALLVICCWYCCICCAARIREKQEIPPPPIIISEPFNTGGEQTVESMFSFLYESEECESQRGSNTEDGIFGTGGGTGGGTDSTSGQSSMVSNGSTERDTRMTFDNAFFQDCNHMMYVRNNKCGSLATSPTVRKAAIRRANPVKGTSNLKSNRNPISMLSTLSADGLSGDSMRGLIGSSSSSGYGCSPKRHFNRCYTVRSELNTTASPTSSSYGETDLSSFSDSESDDITSSVNSGGNPHMTSTPAPTARPRSTRSIPIRVSTSKRDNHHDSLQFTPSHIPRTVAIDYDHYDTDLILATNNSSVVRPSHNISTVSHEYQQSLDSRDTEYANDVESVKAAQTRFANSLMKEQETIANIYINQTEPPSVNLAAVTDNESVWI